MALLEWNEQLSVGIEEMDRQHQVLIGMINDLHSAMLAGKAKDILGNLLEKLLEYTRFHFRSEEALQQSKGFPGIEAHHQLHEDLTCEVSTFLARFQRGEDMLPLHLMSFLHDWLTSHILEEDRGYGAWMRTGQQQD